MSTTNDLVKTSLQFSGEFARLIAHFNGYGLLLDVTKELFKVKGELEFRSSPHHDNFDICVSSEEAFRVNSEFKNFDWDALYDSTFKSYRELKQEKPDEFMGRVSSLPVESAYAFIKRRIVTPDELFDANPDLVKRMAALDLVEIPRSRMNEGRPKLRLMSFER
ncbi:hypothetical protein F3I62_18985 [Pseudomonas sp. R-28-1W-6]|uniref:hypothetical protein n=1 Tax=Pseudomonas sp. R-28-1W-6 TaxID=2650101 RepID=UPI0013658265|nr:hypothetical protein [Pseudomonas sp. R-28-1W-6]MWV14191.1 hypothetical protein [Pseudomonas sp. R-28-1W-6]